MELFNFQQSAVDFLVDKRSVLIGDDMGLGKTVEAIVLDRMRRERQPTIVEKPKTLVITYLGIINSWERHYQNWAPGLRVRTIKPADNARTITAKARNEFMRAILRDDADVFICHWQSLRMLVGVLKVVKWFHIIADECHAIQSRSSQQTIALKELRSVFKSGLSGTPAFDKPDDLWSILNWLYPEFWRSYWAYYNRHIVFTNFSGYRTIVGVAHQNELLQQMSSFYIRRRKEEVLLDLPEKYGQDNPILVDLSAKQFRAYKAMRDDMLAWVGEHENEPIAAPVVIAQLTRLQQFSDAYGELKTVVKYRRSCEDCTYRGLSKCEGHESQVMSITEPSTKLDAVMQIIESTDKPVVVFSQFAQVIKLLGKRLEKAKIPHGLFIGETPPDERDRIIDDFQGGKLRVFAGTIAAGGVGITLTASSTVVFIDRSWSHSMNRQAEDRLHRIGQKNAVQVIDIISKGTIDSKRLEEIQLKWEWIKKLLGESDEDDEPWVTDM